MNLNYTELIPILSTDLHFNKLSEKEYILSNFTSRILGEYEKNNKTYPLSDEIRFIVTNICIENCSKSNEILIIKYLLMKIYLIKEIEFLKQKNLIK